ncbi:MAG: hypothetical protein ACI8RD_014287 [Bacillariaceae sp.]|jgi:hypothetical protein
MNPNESVAEFCRRGMTGTSSTLTRHQRFGEMGKRPLVWTWTNENKTVSYCSIAYINLATIVTGIGAKRKRKRSNIHTFLSAIFKS